MQYRKREINAKSVGVEHSSHTLDFKQVCKASHAPVTDRKDIQAYFGQLNNAAGATLKFKFVLVDVSANDLNNLTAIDMLTMLLMAGVHQFQKGLNKTEFPEWNEGQAWEGGAK
jgi:hypothetical protein